MPLLVRQFLEQNHQNLLVWHLAESTAELVRRFPDPTLITQQLQKMPLEKRQREWLATRLLLSEAIPGATISTLSNGKPVVDNGKYISISHCGEFAALIVGQHPVGLDIQNPLPTIKRIQDKFCNAQERHDALNSPNDLIYLTIIWSVKEAVFKFFGELVTFAEDIHVKTFNITDELIHVAYQGVHGRYDFEIVHQMNMNFHILFTGRYVQRMENQK